MEQITEEEKYECKRKLKLFENIQRVVNVFVFLLSFMAILILLIFIDATSAILIPTFIFIVFELCFNAYINKKRKEIKTKLYGEKEQDIQKVDVENNSKQKLNQVLTIDSDGKMAIYQIEEDDKELVNKVLDKCKSSSDKQDKQ